MNARDESRINYLFKNVGLLALSNLGSKLLVVLLVPLYTAVLSTEQYGSYDLVSITVEFLIPILTLNVADGAMRFAMDADGDKAKIMKFGLIMVAVGTALSSLLLIWQDAPWSSFLGAYVLYVPAMFAAASLYTLMSQFSRGCEHMGDVAIAGVMNTGVLVVLNILCLLVLQMGLDGFFVANILAQLVPGIWLVIRRRAFLVENRNQIEGVQTSIKELLAYAMPLAFSTLGWLIVAVSDRFVVTYFCGIDANGLYSIAYKIPAILNVMQGILIQAWQLSAVKEYGTEESDRFFSRAYCSTVAAMAIFCSLLMPFVPVLASVLFQQEFYSAWIYVPFLLIYVVFNVASGIWGGIFSARKDAFSMAFSMIVGAVLNVLLAVLLVYLIGVQGAAIATLVSGCVIWLIRAARIGKHSGADFHNIRSALIYLVLTLQATEMVFQPLETMHLALQFAGMIVICLITWRDLVDALKAIRSILVGVLRKRR